MQGEIVSAGTLLDTGGRLREPGWARQPLFDANLEQAATGFLGRWRVKRWDYYGIWTPKLFASATLADLGYAGLAFFYVVDLVNRRCVEHTVTRLLGRGVTLPRNSDAGDATYDDGKTRVKFRVAPGKRRLDVTDLMFDEGRGLRINVELDCPAAHESVVVATPIGGGGFYYNRKLNSLPARGSIAWGSRRVRVTPNVAVGQLDWGRGVWPYRSHWLWASATGFLIGGRKFGLNLGAGFSDSGSEMENAIFVQGRLHKLGAVHFDFEPEDYRRPWYFTDDDGRVDLELHPIVERVARTNFGIVRSDVHQVFGRYSGH